MSRMCGGEGARIACLGCVEGGRQGLHVLGVWREGGKDCMSRMCGGEGGKDCMSWVCGGGEGGRD